MVRTKTGLACSLFVGLLLACGSSSGDPADGGTADSSVTDSGVVPTKDGGTSETDAKVIDAGPWETVLTNMSGPFSLTVANGRIYYDDALKGTIESCDEVACKDAKLFVSAGSSVRKNTLKTLDKNIVFATGDGIFEANTTTAVVTPLVARKMNPTAVSVFGNAVYYADKDAAAGAGTVERVIAGQAPEIMATSVSDVRGIYADGTDVFFSTYGIQNSQEGSAIYRASAGAPANSVTKISGSDKILAAHQLRVFGDRVYWVGGGGVFSCPKSGCVGANERVMQEKVMIYEGLGGSLGDTALISVSSVLRDTSLAIPGSAVRETALGTMAQSTTTTANYIYVVSSSTGGDGVIARRKYKP